MIPVGGGKINGNRDKIAAVVGIPDRAHKTIQ
jgi:hypothetical protein